MFRRRLQKDSFPRQIKAPSRMNTNDRHPNWLLGLAGAVAGGAIGVAAYYGPLQVGILALVLPGRCWDSGAVRLPEDTRCC